jgi:putative sigma-54 modulation protein
VYISITAKHLEIDDKLKRYITDKLLKFRKFSENIISARVVMDSEKFRQIAEITVNMKNNRLTATEESSDMYAAVDNAVENMKIQLRRKRDRVKKRRRKVMLGKISRSMKNVFYQGESQAKTPRIIRSGDFAQKPMYVEEAAMELKLLNSNFLVFKNAQTDQVNVVYKRDDGNYGLIEPEF